MKTLQTRLLQILSIIDACEKERNFCLKTKSKSDTHAKLTWNVDILSIEILLSHRENNNGNWMRNIWLFNSKILFIHGWHSHKICRTVISIYPNNGKQLIWVETNWEHKQCKKLVENIAHRPINHYPKPHHNKQNNTTQGPI